MEKKTIGMNAGILWNLLTNNKLWNMQDLQKASRLDTPDFFAALGWLAREDKVDFGHDGNDGHTTITLMVNLYY